MALPPATAFATDTPELELLEFLGQGREEATGEWIDPLAMETLQQEESRAPQTTQDRQEPNRD